ncbi:MAG: hypothetical protein M1127_01775 [Patescibacteria group bacterium]|nr:hypothetical protein [Patescibacteria group bacterium]
MPKYHGEQIPNKEQEKIKVSKLHFLIHPGYELIEAAKAGDDLVKQDLTKYKKLLDSYITEALKIKEKNTELLLLFLSENRDFLKGLNREKNKFNFELISMILFETIDALREILGSRLIVIAENVPPLSIYAIPSRWRDYLKMIRTVTYQNKKSTDMIKAVKQIAKERGFYWDENVESEAYGEYRDICVKEGAKNLQRMFVLKKEPIIREELTDIAWDEKVKAD